MINVINSRSIFTEGSFLGTCSESLMKLARKIKEFFISILRTVCFCFFNKPETALTPAEQERRQGIEQMLLSNVLIRSGHMVAAQPVEQIVAPESAQAPVNPQPEVEPALGEEQPVEQMEEVQQASGIHLDLEARAGFEDPEGVVSDLDEQARTPPLAGSQSEDELSGSESEDELSGSESEDEIDDVNNQSFIQRLLSPLRIYSS